MHLHEVGGRPGEAACLVDHGNCCTVRHSAQVTDYGIDFRCPGDVIVSGQQDSDAYRDAAAIMEGTLDFGSRQKSDP